MTTSPELLALAEPALATSVLNTYPFSEYGYDRLDYGMTIGIERTTGGRLWACWVGGGDNENGYFVLATSDDQGGAWSAPRLVINPHDDTLPHSRRTLVGNLWLDPLGRLWLFFDQAMTYFDGRAGAWYARCDNPDSDNPQWTQPVRMWHGCSLNKPIVCANGDWMIPLSLWDRGKISASFKDAFPELDPLRMAHVFVSRDKGATWERRGGVRFPEPTFDEHNLIQRRDGSIWMTARTGGTNGIWQSVSRDGCLTWSEPSFYLEHCSARHFMRRLASGRLLMVKHGRPVNTFPPCRSHLAAYLSEDDGSTWIGGLLLDDRNDISYPDGTQTPDGRIFISYDLNRATDGHILLARFTEEDVLAGRCVAPCSALRLLISQPNPSAVALRHQREKTRPSE